MSAVALVLCSRRPPNAHPRAPTSCLRVSTEEESEWPKMIIAPNGNTYRIGPGADLTDAILSGADLSGADLSGADLNYANLRDADLSGADLSDAKLEEADLTGAKLDGADLSNAHAFGVIAIAARTYCHPRELPCFRSRRKLLPQPRRRADDLVLHDRPGHTVGVLRSDLS